YNWFVEFQHGRTFLCDEFREGRPSTSVVATNVDAVREMIERDRHMTYREIQVSLGIDMKAIHTILHDHLNVRKLCSRWIPHDLTEAQTWIYSYEPESKQQSTVWIFQNEPKPTKSCSKNSNNQTLSRLIKATYLFVKNYPNFIFIRADKGNIIVVLKRDDYIGRVNNMLSDTDTYIMMRDQVLLLDVVSLFTNILIDLAEKWEHLDAVKLILDSTFFTFLVMDFLENRALKSLGIDIPFYTRYVDDFINYHSLHPLSQKRGVIIDMLDRAVLLSHPKYYSKSVEIVVNTFLENDYPIDFIFNTIHSRLKFLIVHKIQCRDCDAIYEGQTGRLLKTRTKEHRNHINRITSNESVITQHKLEYSHEFE
ncbi:SETMR methyltransferase, partial [Acromyrmex insinuator]